MQQSFSDLIMFSSLCSFTLMSAPHTDKQSQSAANRASHDQVTEQAQRVELGGQVGLDLVVEAVGPPLVREERDRYTDTASRVRLSYSPPIPLPEIVELQPTGARCTHDGGVVHGLERDFPRRTSQEQ